MSKSLPFRPHLHHDGALKDINKRMCVVSMYWVRRARRIFHGYHQTFLAGKVRQVLREGGGHFCLLRLQKTNQHQIYFCNRHRQTLNEAGSHKPASLRDPLISGRRRFRSGLLKPGFEACLAQPRVIPRNERSLAQLNTVVTRVRVSDNLARILPCG